MDKTARIGLMCTPEQKERLKAAASALGLTLSGYLMFCAFERMGEQFVAEKLDAPLNKNLHKSTRRKG